VIVPPDVLVNNAAIQQPQEDIQVRSLTWPGVPLLIGLQFQPCLTVAFNFISNLLQDISPEQLEATFKTNIFSMFYITQAGLLHLGYTPSLSLIDRQLGIL
jgi:NAD(P)-dependent dehydrogenase (short-subunit alcohol dehydrogenase family)